MKTQSAETKVGVSSHATHGEQRNMHQETTQYAPYRVHTASGKQSFLLGVSHTRTVSERYCAPCAQWQPQTHLFAGAVGCPDCGADWHDSTIIALTGEPQEAVTAAEGGAK